MPFSKNIWCCIQNKSLTKYDSKDYEWVKRFVSKHSRGISLKDILSHSLEEGIRFGTRPRDEKPPGREKIRQIVNDYNGKDWDYYEGGGKGKISMVTPKMIDPLAGFGHAAREMMISKIIDSLNELYRKKDKKFKLEEIIELFKVRETIISYPVRFLYLDSSHGAHDKKILFDRALVISKETMRKIKRIETIQKKKNNKFEKTLRNLDQIKNSGLLIAEILGDRREYKDFLNPRNTIRTMYRIKSRS
jgi:hypothetical protein